MIGLVERLRSGLAPDRERHVSSLLDLGRAALLAGDGAAAWLAADRLSRITGPTEAVPLLIRSAASAMLGDPGGADADIKAALERNPDQPEVLASALRHGDAGLRRAAARHALRQPGLRETAIRELRRTGHEAVVVLAGRAESIELHAFWQGERSLELIWRTGTRDGTLTLRPPGKGAAGFDQALRRRILWPGDGPGILIEAPGDRALVEPRILHREAEPPENRRGVGAGRRGLMIVVPVYADAPATARCLECLLAALDGDAGRRIVIVDDASPFPDVVAALAGPARDPRVRLIRQRINLGFAAAVNRALALRAPGEDALIVNADAYVPAGALETLRAAVHAAPDIGTAVPFSNNGEDVSLPRRFQVNPLPSPEGIELLDRLARAANGDETVGIPNGIGFCLYVRAELLDAIGGLSGRYERGYFEDVDFCLRARRAGFRNVCATGAYVGHSGSLSFGGERGALVRRNLARIHAAFPDYRAAADAFLAGDPLAAAARRIGEAYLARRGIERLLLVPARLPERAVRALTAGLQAGEGGLAVLRAGEREGRLSLDLALQDREFPLELGWREPDSGPALPPWLAEARIGRLLLHAPEALPERLIGPLSQRATPEIVAEAPAPAAPAREWRAAAFAGLEGAAAIRTGRLDPEERAAIRALAAARAAEGGALIVLGGGPDDLSLLESPNLWLTGPIGDDEIPDWLARWGLREID